MIEDGAEEFEHNKSVFLANSCFAHSMCACALVCCAASFMDGPRDGSASGLAMLNHIMGLICPSGRDPVTIQGLQVAHGLVYLVSLAEVMKMGQKHTKDVCVFSLGTRYRNKWSICHVCYASKVSLLLKFLIKCVPPAMSV